MINTGWIDVDIVKTESNGSTDDKGPEFDVPGSGLSTLGFPFASAMLTPGTKFLPLLTVAQCCVAERATGMLSLLLRANP